MSSLTSTPDATNSAGTELIRSQFDLSHAFKVISALAIVFAVLGRISVPQLIAAIRHAPTLLTAMTLFGLLPLIVINLVCWVIMRRAPSIQVDAAEERETLHPLFPHRLLFLAATKEVLSLPFAVMIALTSTLTCALMWAVLKRLGIMAGPMINVGFLEGWRNFEPSLYELSGTLVLSTYRTFVWKTYSILRLWVLFGAATGIGILASTIRTSLISRTICTEEKHTTLRRLLLFAPWIVLLDVAFLVGVWITIPNVVPEPGTGFVEGIFDWGKWHWGAWRAEIWIQRGLIPTLLVGLVFCRVVLRRSWPTSIAVASLIVPPVIWISIAWSVLYSSLRLSLLGRWWCFPIALSIAGPWVWMYGPTVWRSVRRSLARLLPRKTTTNV